MEILKNLLVGLVVAILAIMLLGVSIFFWPFIIVAGSLLLISLKLILFIAIFFCFLILIGYIVRKCFKKQD